MAARSPIEVDWEAIRASMKRFSDSCLEFVEKNRPLIEQLAALVPKEDASEDDKDRRIRELEQGLADAVRCIDPFEYGQDFCDRLERLLPEELRTH